MKYLNLKSEEPLGFCDDSAALTCPDKELGRRHSSALRQFIFMSTKKQKKQQGHVSHTLQLIYRGPIRPQQYMDVTALKLRALYEVKRPR